MVGIAIASSATSTVRSTRPAHSTSSPNHRAGKTVRPYAVASSSSPPVTPATPNPGWNNSNTTSKAPAMSIRYTSVGFANVWSNRRIGPGCEKRMIVWFEGRCSVTGPAAVATGAPSIRSSRSATLGVTKSKYPARTASFAPRTRKPSVVIERSLPSASARSAASSSGRGTLVLPKSIGCGGPIWPLGPMDAMLAAAAMYSIRPSARAARGPTWTAIGTLASRIRRTRGGRV